MITEEQYLLLKLAEECNETAQRALKAVQFGINEVQAGQDLANGLRLRNEMLDILTICIMLRERHGVELFNFASNADMRYMNEHQQKVFKYLALSRSLGQVE